jgi:methylated-DNA-[protein]-cysteine S-methyltransferase
MDVSCTLFETAIGTGAIAWTPRGVAGTYLPDADSSGARAWLRRRFPHAVDAAAPPAEVQRVVDDICRLLRGEAPDLTYVALDFKIADVPEFDRQVYAVARTVPAGQTISYGEIATRLGDVHLAREVGQALAHNPFPIVVPCHRVLAANGKLGGFSARGGVATKQRLLEIERASVTWQLPLV